MITIIQHYFSAIPLGSLSLWSLQGAGRGGGGEGLIYYDLLRESRNLEGYEILGSPAREVEQVLIYLEVSKD